MTDLEYTEGIEKINKIYEVFKDYYGEERVDLQNIMDKQDFLAKSTIRDAEYPFIIVHFPEVTVTNENNDSVLVKDLWAKVIITFNGKIHSGFSLNRSTYQYSHWVSDYMHSHIPGIPKTNITTFLSPCLGSGPIKNTIASLAGHFDEALWSLFCRELDVYTRTESLSGGPYRRMTNIGSAERSNYHYITDFDINIAYTYDNFELGNLKRFILYLIDKDVLKFNFDNGTYSLAMDWYDYYITISDVFIEWYNKMYNEREMSHTLEDLISMEIIVPVEIRDRHIFKATGVSAISQSMSRTRVLRFKGHDVLLHIEPAETADDVHIYHVLNKYISANILRTLLTIINYKYGRENTESATDTTKRYLV